MCIVDKDGVMDDSFLVLNETDFLNANIPATQIIEEHLKKHYGL